MTGSDDEREFRFTRADFERVRQLLYEYAGISLSDSKKDMVYARLSRRLRQRGLDSFRAYLDLVERRGEEWQAFVNALTTNLTSFFRESHHFPILAELARTCPRRPIRVWCSAASTGEEPYTIAMTLVDTFGSLQPPVEIIATDIDTQVLEKARAGIYSEQVVDKLPAQLVRRFFRRGTGSRAGLVRVRRELCRLVQFRQLNLLAPEWPAEGPFEAIFCRNVMIYFDKETQYKILRRFVPLLDPDGLLFAGHSESLHHAADLFRLRGRSVYGLTEAMRLSRMRTAGGQFGAIAGKAKP